SMAAPGRLARVAKRCRIVDYAEVARRMMAKPTAEYRRFPCVLAGWDNSPRRPQGAFVLVERDPRVYGEWLANAIDRAAALGSEPLVFINAWNEWAEGAYLEPCRRFGSRFLEATAAAVGRAESVRTD
ncbi:MAG: glycoside hydrolase family 99-like domain-containing protein, partial [Candidatus Binatia bacterium]